MAQAAASTCEICTAGPGEYYCQQCDQSFCGSCKSSHLRTKSCKNHTFLSGPNINKEDKLLCTEHEEIYFFYCQDCDTPVCRICSVEKHSRHLMTDLTKSAEKLRFEVVKNIEAKVTTSKVNLSKIEKETKTYRDEVKAVIKTITEEGNYWKNLIDKKVGSFVRLLHDEEQKTIQNITALTIVYRRDIENCQQWEKKIKEMETMADILLFERLKKLKVDVDNIDLKPVPKGSYVSYRNKKPSGTEIDSLFGEMQFKEGNALMEKTDRKQNTRAPESQKKYKYACGECGNEQISTNEPITRTSKPRNERKTRWIDQVYIQGLRIVCTNSNCDCYNSSCWHHFIGEA